MKRAPVVVGRTRVRSTIRARLARTPLRERMVLALLLLDRLRPAEVATTLGMSLRQVERIRFHQLTRLARAADAAHAGAPVRRAA
jgi:DNA-directed RNA polymerase specialized sigma24 family protein